MKVQNKVIIVTVGGYENNFAADAAEMIIQGMEQNKYRVLVGKDSRFINLLYRWNTSNAANLIYKK